MKTTKKTKEVADKTLARVEKKETTIVPYDGKQLTDALIGFSQAIATISKETAPKLWDSVKKMKDLVEEYEKTVRQYVLDMVVAEGKTETEAGTKRMTRSGYRLEVQPSGGGYDAKKVEALLRSKDIGLLLGMDTKVTYTVNEGKLTDLINKKKVTEDELDTCRSEKGWKVMSPVKEE